jgi:hypothetical protein
MAFRAWSLQLCLLPIRVCYYDGFFHSSGGKGLFSVSTFRLSLQKLSMTSKVSSASSLLMIGPCCVPTAILSVASSPWITPNPTTIFSDPVIAWIVFRMISIQSCIWRSCSFVIDVSYGVRERICAFKVLRPGLLSPAFTVFATPT